MLPRLASLLILAVGFAACDSGDQSSLDPGDPPVIPPNNTEAHPLTAMDTDENGEPATYFGFEGGLYFGGDELPAAHAAYGAQMASEIQPLDAAGQPSADGEIVLMSISMSNASQEWCHANSDGAPGSPPCHSHTFMGRASVDPSLNDDLVIVNGAKGGQALDQWDSPTDDEYARLAEVVLPAYGLTEAQVQVVWVKVVLTNQPSRPSLPDPNADAFVIEETLGRVMRALKARYPNLKQVFFTSRIYGGYASPTQNSPEPWAFETGFATKWAIEAQITQRETGEIDPETGDVAETAFMAWGPYLWSYGDRPRADGLIWTREMFGSDGMHPSTAGESTVAEFLLDFFKTSPLTQCWFLEGFTCP